jgi:hypothetical protein
MSESNDISEKGMFLGVSEDSVSKLEVSGMIIGQGEDLRVSLSNPRKTMEFIILCTIAHVSINDLGQYLIGLKFEDKRDSFNKFIYFLIKTFNG